MPLHPHGYQAHQAHPYAGRAAVLATRHGKERLLARPLRVAPGLRLRVPPDLDTDALGTFTGEVARVGTPLEVARRKARLGMEAMGLPLGLASEGSFGPHPAIPFLPADHELLLFMDDERSVEVVEQMVSERTNYAQVAARSADDLDGFLARAGFPAHAVIVRANAVDTADAAAGIVKGIRDRAALAAAVTRCAAASNDRLARVETDMRAHMNPSRARVIRRLATRLARRLATLCPDCGAPGWGVVERVPGLPCGWCGAATDLTRAEVRGCAACGLRRAPAAGRPGDRTARSVFPVQPLT